MEDQHTKKRYGPFALIFWGRGASPRADDKMLSMCRCYVPTVPKPNEIIFSVLAILNHKCHYFPSLLCLIVS